MYQDRLATKGLAPLPAIAKHLQDRGLWPFTKPISDPVRPYLFIIDRRSAGTRISVDIEHVVFSRVGGV
jgi:hypothetical protein